ncbi:unnamed protein product [Boreogadus saida]
MVFSSGLAVKLHEEERKWAEVHSRTADPCEIQVTVLSQNTWLSNNSLSDSAPHEFLSCSSGGADYFCLGGPEERGSPPVKMQSFGPTEYFTH